MQASTLSEALRQALQAKVLSNPSGVWTDSLISELLKEDCSVANTADQSFGSAEGSTGSTQLKYPGVPSRPFYSAMATVVCLWDEKAEFPFKHIPFPLLKEKPVYFERLAQMQLEVLEMKEAWGKADQAGQLALVDSFLEKRTLRDVLSLVGMRHTEGSLDYFPPSLQECFLAFNTLHKPETASVLTVGAKALTKHCHRDETANWWGKVTGSEANKNKLSSEVVTKILDHVVWMNIHQLPHNIRIFEVRHEDGYGARWGMFDEAVEGQGAVIRVDFRGFLEPQMEDGHAAGWRH